MKVSYQWLQDYVTVGDTPADLAEKLTGVGVAVDTVTPLNEGVRGVVAGRIEKVVPHPSAATLLVCTVNVGAAEALTIVTGAPNVRPGDMVPVAVPGAAIAGGREIDVAEFRGVTSQGMLCAPDELGIPEGHDGILILPPDTPVGADCVGLLGLDDQVLQLDLTANYASHCQAMIGVAQEYAALTAQAVRWPQPAVVETGFGRIADRIRIRIEDPDLCPRYAGRMIEGVTIGPSPPWLQSRLRAAGMRPINNIVDITNFVMLELGQPLHAFDYERIRGQEVIVRRARDGEELTTLDGQRRVLDREVLVIADNVGPMVIAGVMGGEDSEVTDQTRTIFLESALFQNINNRRTSRRYSLPSEASSRYTKGVDPSGVIRAMDRAAQLMAELAGGRVVPGILDVYPRPYPPRVIPVRLRRLRTLIGLPLDLAEVRAHLERLGMQVLAPADLRAAAAALASGAAEPDTPVWQAIRAVSPVPTEPEAYAGWAAAAREQVQRAADTLARWPGPEAEVFVVVVPTRRLDITIEDDIVEEVCRQHGYDRIEATLPTGPAVRGGRQPDQEVVLAARRILAGAGLNEVLTYSLTHPRVYDWMRLPADSPYRRYLTVQNPLLEERSILRTLLLPSLLAALQYNINRQVRDAALFEIWKVYHPQDQGKLADEQWRLAIVGHGQVAAKTWNSPAQAADFYWLKGVLELLLERLGVAGADLGRPAECVYLHPGRSAGLWLGGQQVGVYGELHPEVQAAWDLPGRTYVAEIEFAPLVAGAMERRSYAPVARHPAVVRDVALVIREDLPAAAILDTIHRAGGEWLEEVRLFDLYRGDPVPAGKRSLAYSLTYRAPDRTLTDAEVGAVQDQVRAALVGLGAELRS